MEPLLLVGACALGTVFPLLNPELATAAFAAKTGWHPLAVGAFASAGQCLTYAVIQALGGVLVPRWAWLARQVDRVRARWAAHLERRYLVIALPAGLIGIPPAVGLAALGRAFGIPVTHLTAVLFVGRTFRMAAIAAFGRGIFEWWGS